MKPLTFLFRTEIDGKRHVIPVQAFTIREARVTLRSMLWPGETEVI